MLPIMFLASAIWACPGRHAMEAMPPNSASGRMARDSWSIAISRWRLRSLSKKNAIRRESLLHAGRHVERADAGEVSRLAVVVWVRRYDEMPGKRVDEHLFAIGRP